MVSQNGHQQDLGSLPNTFQGRRFGQQAHRNSGHSRLPRRSQLRHNTGDHSSSTRHQLARPHPLTASTNHSLRHFLSNISAVTPATGTSSARTYCWMHGITTNLAHTSATCSNKGPGHQDDATNDNKMRGATFICLPRNRG
jgi:hypothetical protein